MALVRGEFGAKVDGVAERGLEGEVWFRETLVVSV